MTSNVGSFPLKLYSYREFLIERCDSYSRRLLSHYIWTK